MTEKIQPKDYEEIERLVRGEVDQALEEFRAGDFKARVRRRLAAEKKPVRRRVPLLVKIAVPAAAVLLLVVAAAVYVIFTPSEAPVRTQIDASAIAAVLRELPRFSAQAVDLTPGPAGEQAPAGTGAAIAGVLGAVGAGTDLQAGPGLSRPEVSKAPRLTMKKRMEILFKDKVIERVLMSWAAKAKEA